MTYDGIYRLTNEAITSAPSGNNGSVGYGLDPVGNRLTETSSLSGIDSGTFSFNADDELSGESYDQNGNVTAADSKTFTYDSERRVAPIPIMFPNHAEGARGPSHLGTGDGGWPRSLAFGDRG
jgi:hypothetical protein